MHPRVWHRFMLGVTRYDTAIRHRFTAHWDAEMRRRYLANLCIVRNESDVHRAALRTIDQLDAKATGILTHVSMMITAMGVTAASEIANHVFERLTIYLTIGLYLLLAVACLRCIDVLPLEAVTAEPGSYTADLIEELVYRKTLYAFANRGATLLTCFVFVMLFVFFFS